MERNSTMSVDIITDNLRDGYKRLTPGTFLHVDDLIRNMNEYRRSAESSEYFYTADGIIYFNDILGPQLAITREQQNPELTSVRRWEAIEAKNTVIINLTELKLANFSGHISNQYHKWCSITIPTDDYSNLNKEERKLAKRVCGQRNNRNSNIERVTIYLPPTDSCMLQATSWLFIVGREAHFYIDTLDAGNPNKLCGRSIDHKAV